MRWAQFGGSPLIFQEPIAIRASFRGQVLDWTSSFKKKKNPLRLTKYTKTTPGLESPHVENGERMGLYRGRVSYLPVLFTLKVYGCCWRQDACADELTR